MNVEEMDKPGYDNSGYDEPKKSGRSWLACFGIGCVVLFLLCGVGAGITWFAAGDYLKMGFEQAAMHTESINLAIVNEEVVSRLGDPVQPAFAMPQTIPGDDGRVTQKVTVPLSGPNGSGTLNVEYEMKPGEPVRRTVFNVEIDGEIIDMLESDGMELDIDDGVDDMDFDSEDADAKVSEDEPVGAGR